MVLMLYAAVAILLMVALQSVNCLNCTKIVTSNVGLTASVGRVQERSVITAHKYSTLDADVVCAQEFWHEEDIIRVLNESPSFKYHFSPIHESLSQLQPNYPSGRWCKLWKEKPGERATCKAWEMNLMGDLLFPCASACLGAGNQVLEALCTIARCQSILKLVTEDCVSCIIQTLAPLPEAIVRCNSFSMGRRFNAPGLLLLSKKKILSARYKRLFTERMMLQRGYIEAEIQDVGTVVCTHLSANLGAFFEYDLPPEITDYEVQQREEINRIHSTFNNQTLILIGDMNTGPETQNNPHPDKNNVGEYAANYAHLISLGYRSPYETEVGYCTYCTNNPLVAGRFPNHIIDHVLFKGPGYTINSVERILNFTQPEPMSDHYGVRVEFCKNND